MQGIPAGFAITTLTNYLIAQGVSALYIGSFDAIIGIPWVFQFIWGPLIDRFQYSPMGHRKHWIVYSQFFALLASLSLLVIRDPVHQVSTIAAIFFVHSIFASVQDASVDASAIGMVPVTEQGRINAFMRAGLLFGVAIGAAGLSTVLHSFGFFAAAAWQSGLLLCFTVLTYITKFERRDSYLPFFSLLPAIESSAVKVENPELQWLFKRVFMGIMRKKSLRLFGLIALIYLCLNIFYRSFSFHLIHNLHWNDQTLSVFQGTWASLVTIAVTLGGGIIADKIGPGKLQRIVILFICSFFLVFSSLGYLWQHKVFSMTGILLYNLADPLFSVAAMPVLMGLCLAKVEGSQFTAYMALVNLCDVMAAYISGFAMTFTTAPIIGFICGMVILTALFIEQARKKQVWQSFTGSLR